MNDQEAIRTLIDGFDILCNQAKIITMFPIEEWLETLEKGETIAPYIDPTLYRQYIYSRKPELLKKVLKAALELKRTMLEMQPEVADMLRRGIK